MDRHAIKQVDPLLSNAGVVVWDLFAPWAREVGRQGRTEDQRNAFEDLCLTRLKAILPEGVAVLPAVRIRAYPVRLPA